MSKFTLAVVGKLRADYLRSAEKEYQKRLTRYCRLAILEHKNEAELKKSLAGHAIIAFDERGIQPTSREFAAMVDDTRQVGSVGLAIGPAEGFSPSFRQQAKHVIAFGRMTLPHQIARVLVVEQLYRAFRIINGEPYHKD